MRQQFLDPSVAAIAQQPMRHSSNGTWSISAWTSGAQLAGARAR
jgi:hypothetical protein